MPWGLARQELALFLGRKLGDPLQVKVDTDGERFFDFVERLTERRNIHVNTDCLPSITYAVSMAFEVKDHFRLPGFRVIKSDISRQINTARLSLHGESPHEPDEIPSEGQIFL